MSTAIYLEGGAVGAGSRELNIRCREGFRKLLERSGFDGRLPRLTACGSRNNAYADFCIANAGRGRNDFVALWVDSEDPVRDPETPWAHLHARDGWTRPAAVGDDQVFLMTTCMETWIVADRATLARHYGANFQENALPPTNDLEARSRQDVQERLARATRMCPTPYAKGARSFEILSVLAPDVLRQLLPSFARAYRILDRRL